MANAWMSHLASFRKKNRNLSLRQAMEKAKSSYKKIAVPKTHKKKSPGKSRKKSPGKSPGKSRKKSGKRCRK